MVAARVHKGRPAERIANAFDGSQKHATLTALAAIVECNTTTHHEIEEIRGAVLGKQGFTPGEGLYDGLMTEPVQITGIQAFEERGLGEELE